MNVAIQGQAGSFHDHVAKRWYGSSVTIVPCTTFADVFEAYASGAADSLVVAVENSIYGSINDVYQLIEARVAGAGVVEPSSETIHPMGIVGSLGKLPTSCVPSAAVTA